MLLAARSSGFVGPLRCGPAARHRSRRAVAPRAAAYPAAESGDPLQQAVADLRELVDAPRVNKPLLRKQLELLQARKDAALVAAQKDVVAAQKDAALAAAQKDAAMAAAQKDAAISQLEMQARAAALLLRLHQGRCRFR